MFETTANCELPHRSDGGGGKGGGSKTENGSFHRFRMALEAHIDEIDFDARNDRPYLKTSIKLSMIILQEFPANIHIPNASTGLTLLEI